MVKTTKKLKHNSKFNIDGSSSIVDTCWYLPKCVYQKVSSNNYIKHLLPQSLKFCKIIIIISIPQIFLIKIREKITKKLYDN